jgi:hypothetical protein
MKSNEHSTMTQIEMVPRATAGDIEEGKIDSASAPEPSKRSLAMVSEQTYIEKLAFILALAAVVSSIVSLAMVGGLFIKWACVLILILSPYSYYQQTRITDIRALKKTYTALKGEVDQLAESNQELKLTIGRLGVTVTKLEEIETVIEGITQIKGQSVESLLKAVKENKETVELMEKNVRAAVVQNILSVIFAIDENDDRLLSKTETTNLIKSLREINGVMVDEKKFRAMIKDKNGSIDGVMDVIENMLDDSSSNEESTNTIFTFDES